MIHGAASPTDVGGGGGGRGGRNGRSDRLVQLHSGDEYAISIDSFKDGAQESSLRITSVDESNFDGGYRCLARNKFGSDSVDIRLLESRVAVDYSQPGWTFAASPSAPTEREGGSLRQGDRSSGATRPDLTGISLITTAVIALLLLQISS